MSADYTIQALHRGLLVIEYLAQGQIDEWKTIREVAAATKLPENTCYRLLETLQAKGWAEKSGKGYRQGTKGLMTHLIYARDYYFKKLAERGVQ